MFPFRRNEFCFSLSCSFACTPFTFRNNSSCIRFECSGFAFINLPPLYRDDTRVGFFLSLWAWVSVRWSFKYPRNTHTRNESQSEVERNHSILFESGWVFYSSLSNIISSMIIQSWTPLIYVGWEWSKNVKSISQMYTEFNTLLPTSIRRCHISISYISGMIRRKEYLHHNPLCMDIYIYIHINIDGAALPVCHHEKLV